MQTDPMFICRACGLKYGQDRLTIPPSVTTMHQGVCDYCGEEAILCHVRNYRWPKFPEKGK